MYMTYAGIGSRATPDRILGLFTGLAMILDRMGFTLRSGGAEGADKAFEQGVLYSGNKEIFLPWKHFNHNQSGLYPPSDEAYKMAAHYHPNWNACSANAKAFHARNCHQVLGSGLNVPAAVVVCWTPNGEVTGGTGQALRIALDKEIPIINFGEYNDPVLALHNTVQCLEGYHMSMIELANNAELTGVHS